VSGVIPATKDILETSLSSMKRLAQDDFSRPSINWSESNTQIWLIPYSQLSLPFDLSLHSGLNGYLQYNMR
jgi:hypothetical protein